MKLKEEKSEKGQVKTPIGLMVGSICSFASCLLLVMAYASPYWLVSWHDTYSPFVKMGLWEFCFRRYRYPSYQFDELFDGCKYIFSLEYYKIWEWLLPAWLMAVQAFMSLGLIFSTSSLIIISMYLTRWPLLYTARYNCEFVGASSVLAAASSACLFLSVTIFGGQCWRRDWLLYPNFNYLSWSYAFATIGFFGFAFSSYILYQEYLKLREWRKAGSNLVMQMQSGHASGSHTYI